MDVSRLGISGYQAADWLRAQRRVTVGLSDHRRIVAQFTHADDELTSATLFGAIGELVEAASELPTPPTVEIPEPSEFELETAMLPRDAFFGPAAQVPIDRAPG